MNSLKMHNFLCFKGGYDQKHKESAADINQFLQHVEAKFSDVLIISNQIVAQEYIGKGCVYIQVYVCMLQYAQLT